ncbi:MAG: hypothetical protein QY318_02015 [Candidatus Dojkabacteria bacterium]|nr:MAG: hypothetical protein QY318_02015 [Candidatus Dojkabacteria bacterium]
MDPKESTKQGGTVVNSAAPVSDKPQMDSVKDTAVETPAFDADTNTPAGDVKTPTDDEAKKKKKMMVLLLVILLLLLGLLGYIGYTMYQQSQEDNNPTIVVDVEDDEDENEDTTDEGTDESTDDEDDETTPPVDEPELTAYDYTFYTYELGTGEALGQYDVVFTSSRSDFVVQQNGPDSDSSPEVGKLLLGAGNTDLKFSVWYEGFSGSFEGVALTEVAQNPNIGIIHRHESIGTATLDTNYVSDLTMSGTCLVMGENVPAPCGPSALQISYDGDAKWVWMSCDDDPGYTICDEVARSLDITFTPAVGVNPL